MKRLLGVMFSVLSATAVHAADTIIVGAPSEESSSAGINGNQSDNSLYASGAAYIFSRSGTVWTQQSYLKASNPGRQNGFGSSVAVAGDIVAVGAGFEGTDATGVNLFVEAVRAA